MDLSLLKTLNNKLSLTDYLGSAKNSYFSDISNSLMSTVAKSKTAAIESEAAANVGVNVSLSAEAQALLENGNGENSNLSGVQKAAQNFLIGFFDQSGLEIEKLSDEALDLIQGLQDVISGSTATGRDLSTDVAEGKYAGGNKQVYTLTGSGTRLRLAVDYADGKPTKLSVTDITGGQVETAEITLSEDTMTINRTQREYKNGHMTGLVELDPLDVKLYTTAS
jgi:hypothetical protein